MTTGAGHAVLSKGIGLQVSQAVMGSAVEDGIVMSHGCMAGSAFVLQSGRQRRIDEDLMTYLGAPERIACAVSHHRRLPAVKEVYGKTLPVYVSHACRIK